jgi:hypothetical protein
LGDHFLVFLEKLVVVDLELLDDGELFVFPGEEVDEVAFGG